MNNSNRKRPPHLTSAVDTHGESYHLPLGPADSHGIPTSSTSLTPLTIVPPSPVVQSPMMAVSYQFPPVAISTALLPADNQCTIFQGYQPASQQMRILMPKQRYTAEEDLFIRFARAESIPWNMIAIVLKERYQHADTRNSKNLQVHYSQKINSTAATSDALTPDETAYLENWLTARLGSLYAGVANEFSRTTLKVIDPRFVQQYVEQWKIRTSMNLEVNLEIARSMAFEKKDKEAKKRKTT